MEITNRMYHGAWQLHFKGKTDQEIINHFSYCSLDHIIPVSKGGLNELDNLQICSWYANFVKQAGSKEELLHFLKEVLEFNSYKVSNPPGFYDEIAKLPIF